MEILEAFALTNSCRAAGELAGCSHHTVEHWVTMRDKGLVPDGQSPVERAKLIDGFMPKIEEWVERSNGRVRGDVVFDKLVGLGFEGSDRTVRRALAGVKLNWKAGRRRVYRPWVVEPGMWAQWDWGHGPKIGGRQTYLFCAWLAWSRFRVVIAVWDKTLPTVIACLDRSMRAFGGVPTYWLTDNEKTVSTGHVAGIAGRAHADRSGGVGSRRRRRDRRDPTSPRQERLRLPATCGPRQATRASMTPTTRHDRPARWPANHDQATLPKPSSWRSVTAHECGSSKPPRRARRGSR